MKTYPKILIISHCCFSKTDSNGRTLAGFFKTYPKKKLAQFYMQNAFPDFDVCENYFRVTDSEALQSFLKNKKVGKRIEINYDTPSTVPSFKKKRKTPFTMLLREWVWNSRKWWKQDFENWISDFSPDLVLLQAGNNAFILKIATDIAKKRNIPLIIYNSENYYFKNKNYMRNSGIFSLLYPLFQRKFRKEFKKTIAYASYSIYSCESLKEVYDKKFNKPSEVLYTVSELENKEKTNEQNQIPQISYLGNLGVGRHEPLIEIANALQKINTNYRLNVYGKLPNAEVESKLLNCSGISYKGFVAYENVVAIMKQSDLLIHVENFSVFYQEDLKFAFSTKIADSLACGTCLFYYAPASLASTVYLSKNRSAFVVTDKNNLLKSLNEALQNYDKKQKIIDNALLLSKENHNALKNIKKFLEIIEKACL